MTTRAVAADVDPLSLERLVCFALAITNPRLRSATDKRTMQVELTTKGRTLRRKALTIPPAVVERLGVDLDKLEHLHDVLTAINAAALAADILDAELDR